MEIERYKALLCVIDTGSMSAAAEKLGYTPSGMSRMMAAIEEENGFPLLIRKREGIFPTADCRIMLPAIRELIFAGEKCRQISQKIRGNDVGTVIVGTAYNAYYEWLANIASQFHKIYPGIKIEFRNGYSSGLAKLMSEHRVDICFISYRDGMHDWISLSHDPMVAWVPSAHEISVKKEISLKIFETEPYIEIYPGQDSDNARILKAHNIKPNIRFSTMDSLAAYSMVEAGLGVTMNNMMNEPPRNGAVKLIPLSDAEPVNIGVAISRELSPAAATFAGFLNEKLANGALMNDIKCKI